MKAITKKKVLILGCTGSIGQNSIALMKEYPNDFEVVGLSAHRNEAKLKTFGKECNCTNLFLSENNEEGFAEFISQTKADIAINGISGFAGLLPSIHCLEAKMDLALANKESIVSAGDLLQSIARKNNKKIIPVDSEHSAVFSLIQGLGKNSVKKILLTASGGPFRLWEKERFPSIRVQDALAHPTWSMGKKISIDSATLANKGLEVIEASKLFSLDAKEIQVLIHPQSIVHSMVQSKDGAYYAQLSPPSMKQAILYALNYPEIKENNLPSLDFSQDLALNFSPPRMNDFPMLALAYEVLEKDGALPIVYNAANEIFVHAFLEEKIRFIDIPVLTEKILNGNWSMKPNHLEDVIQIDRIAREKAGALI